MNTLKLIQKQVAVGLKRARLLVPVTLVKVATGARDPLAPASGGLPVTTTSYATQGIVASYTDTEIDGTLIRRGDRAVRLFGYFLQKPGGIVPVPGDRIEAEGNTYTIVAPGGVTRDAAIACYVCQCRK